MKIFCKQYGLNYFSLGYWKGIFVPKITQWVCNTSFKVYQKSFGHHHISIETWKGIA